MRIRPTLFPVLVVAIFLAPVVVANEAGLWVTTGGPGAGQGGGGGGESGQGGDQGENGQGGGPGGEGGGPGGGRVVAPGDARGWMTLQQVAEVNAIPVSEILVAFDLPPGTYPATALRELESEGFSVAALRAWLAERASP